MKTIVIVILLIIGGVLVFPYLLRPVNPPLVEENPADTSSVRVKVISESEAIIPNWQWVIVMNLTPIESGNTSFDFRETCGIEFGGKVRIIDEIADQFLVEYESPHERVGGTVCPTGVIFFIEKNAFGLMTGQYNALVEATAQEKALIKAMLESW